MQRVGLGSILFVLGPFYFSVFLLHVVLVVSRTGEVKELARPCLGHLTRTVVNPCRSPAFQTLAPCSELPSPGVQLDAQNLSPPGPPVPRGPPASICNSRRVGKPVQATALIGTHGAQWAGVQDFSGLGERAQCVCEISLNMPAGPHEMCIRISVQTNCITSLSWGQDLLPNLTKNFGFLKCSDGGWFLSAF